MRTHRVVTGRDRGEKLALLHRRRLREVGRRAIERERYDPQLRVGRARQLINGRTAGGEIRHHLDRDFGWIR